MIRSRIRHFFDSLKRLFSRKKSPWKECNTVRFDDTTLYLEGTTPEGDAFQEQLQ